jgi:hypothetical protein
MSTLLKHFHSDPIIAVNIFINQVLVPIFGFFGGQTPALIIKIIDRIPVAKLLTQQPVRFADIGKVNYRLLSLPDL